MSSLQPRLSAPSATPCAARTAPWPQRVLPWAAMALLALAALSGCRKGVAPPPSPDEVPKPKATAQAQAASRYALSTEGVRLGR